MVHLDNLKLPIRKKQEEQSTQNGQLSSAPSNQVGEKDDQHEDSEQQNKHDTASLTTKTTNHDKIANISTADETPGQAQNGDKTFEVSL